MTIQQNSRPAFSRRTACPECHGTRVHAPRCTMDTQHARQALGIMVRPAPVEVAR